jgi:acyl-CoA reductase-like NAD-dependent aldehyde dehydrogenase
MTSTLQPQIDFLDETMRLYIDGAFVETEGSLPTINPATGEVLANAPLATEREVDAAVAAAARVFDAWRFTPPTQRARLMWKLADLLEANKDEFATIEVLDNGKPMWEAQAVDIALTIELLRYYGGWTTKIDGKVLPNSISGMFTIAKREPVGVVLCIPDLNPFLRGTRSRIGLHTPWHLLKLKLHRRRAAIIFFSVQLVDEAGSARRGQRFIGGPEVGAAPFDPGVQKVAFTGQTATGRRS